LSDEKIIALKKYGAWGEKSMYGKKFMGIRRTTVLINPKGKIIKIWNNVKVTDHAKEVLSLLKETI
jgi:peroxiredoxin Q/BCP